MLEEFEQRTGFYPTQVQYEAIERAYMDFDGDKDAFCKAYKSAEFTRRDIEIERLKKELEREQEWKPYEDTHNVTQEQYTELAESVPGGAAHYMTDAEALDWICSEFGFDRSKVTILHEIDEYEVNRHHQLRRTGKKIDRRPVYCATDYHYIRFNVGRNWWECWSGQLCPFYD